MPANQYTVNLRGPFNALDKVERVLEICETKLQDQVSSITEITSIPSAERVVLLVQFAGGLKIKLSVFALDQQSFGDCQRFLDTIRLPNFSRVVVAGDGWAAFEWIEGATVRKHGVNDDILRKAARLLSAIHAAGIDPPANTSERVFNQVRLKLAEKLPVLAANDIVSDAQSQMIINLRDSISADSFNISLIHGDFSPDNLVIRGNELYSVDNDKIRFQVTDYDLCRAVNLWDEWNLSGAALSNAYAEASGRTFTTESLRFWGIFDLVYRISYRISSAGEFNEFCINRLRQILTTGAFR